MGASKVTSLEVNCYTCNKTTSKRPTEIAKSNSGKLFCSKTCSATENNKLRKAEAHYNYKDGVGSYRSRALEYYGSSCTVCGYDIEAVLHVHHKDEDRSNNVIENLDVLCPTHHVEYHRGIRSY